MKNVLVIGANGKTGTILTQKLKMHPDLVPFAMIRKEEQKTKFEEMGVETVLADLENDIAPALKGKEYVVFAAGSGSKTGPDKTTAVDEEGAIRSVKAAEELGIEKYVMLSAMGTDNPEAVPAMEHYLQAKHNADEALMKSKLNYTIVSPGRLTDNPASNKIKAEEKLNEHGEISREDVAEVMLQSLVMEELKNQKIEILEGERPLKEVLQNF